MRARCGYLSMCTCIFQPLSTPLLLCACTLWISTDHRPVGLGKLCETRTDRFQVFLKILFVYMPAFSSLNASELEMVEKMCRKVKVLHSYPHRLIHELFWATLVLVEGKASLIFCERLNTDRWDVRTRCMQICYFDNVSLILKKCSDFWQLSWLIFAQSRTV